MSNDPGANHGKQSVNLVATVLEITAPVFLLGLIGFVWVRAGFEYRLQFVTRLSMTLAVPCLIFTALMDTEIAPAALAALTGASLVAYGVIGCGAALLVLALRLPSRTYTAPLIFGNTGNLGLPLALFAFGEAGLGLAVVVFAVMAVLSFTAGLWLVSGGGGIGRVMREPMVAATLLGALFMAMDWRTPTFLTNALSLVGQMAIPLMLITLGVAVARLSADNLWRAGALSLVKMALCVGVAWSVGRWFGLDDTAFAVLVLQIATPVAVTSYMLAEKYGADADAVAGLVVTSTVMSIGALPLLLAVLL